MRSLETERICVPKRPPGRCVAREGSAMIVPEVGRRLGVMLPPPAHENIP